MSNEFEVSKKELYTVDVELKNKKAQLIELQKLISNEEEKKKNLEENLYKLTLSQRNLVVNLKENVEDLSKKQTLFNDIFQSEISLLQVLGESWNKTPNTKEERESIIPAIKEFIPKMTTSKPLPKPTETKPLPTPTPIVRRQSAVKFSKPLPTPTTTHKSLPTVPLDTATTPRKAPPIPTKKSGETTIHMNKKIESQK
jgi:hypothetical protein